MGTVGVPSPSLGRNEIQLSHWLQFNCPHHPHTSETAPAIDAPTVLIIPRGQQWVGLQIDRSWGEQEVAIRKVEGNIPLPSGFANCVIVGDGRVIIPLVNTAELLDWITSYPPISTWSGCPGKTAKRAIYAGRHL